MHLLYLKICQHQETEVLATNKVKVSGKGTPMYMSGVFALWGILKLVLLNKKGKNLQWQFYANILSKHVNTIWLNKMA